MRYALKVSWERPAAPVLFAVLSIFVVLCRVKTRLMKQCLVLYEEETGVTGEEPATVGD